MTELTFERLHRATEGDTVALRALTELQPAGGKGDKIFPPSYMTDGGALHKYAIDTIRN